MKWINEPDLWAQEKEYLWVQTSPDTDFWQRTHYEFQRDTAHAYLRSVIGDFSMSARCRFYPADQYDQCGLLIRQNPDTWFTCSIEYENPQFSRLGSVLTSFGYSDWAGEDISSEITEIWYSLEYTQRDIIASYSYDGRVFHQMRICHFHSKEDSVLAGMYGCSPQGRGFRFEVSEFSIR